jgi:LmbE family N-acetylglucosaminyl deacetylase
VLGIASTTVANYPDGGLSRCPKAELTERIRRAIREHAPDLLLVIDPAAGDPDGTVVAAATGAAASQAGVPVVACTVADARGAWMIDLGADAETARAIRRSAAAAHASQSEELPLVLARLAGQDYLRWLVPASRLGPWWERRTGRERLAPYKTPLYWVLVDAFPMTPSGKIQKFKLREGFIQNQPG